MAETSSTLVAAPRRSRWLKTLHLWHWLSAALSLLCMLMFSITGITLNHASRIESQPRVMTRHAILPTDLLNGLRVEAAGSRRQVPSAFLGWMKQTWHLAPASAQDPEWSPEEFYLPLPRPGGDAWLRVDLASGEVEYEITDRGWISYLNDLHKGRNAGPAWGWFIDLFAVLCLLFSLTGLLILKFHAANRPSTWPVVGLGVLVPLLLMLLLVH